MDEMSWPAKNTYRNRIGKMVHDISASGNTVYIEPRAVVNLNEEIRQPSADERFEMLRSWKKFQTSFSPHAGETGTMLG